MIKVLENPITENFLKFKEYVFSTDFTWNYETSTGMDFYSHTFLRRPEDFKYSKSLSESIESNLTVLSEIIDHNKLFDRNQYFFLRSNANCVHSSDTDDGSDLFSQSHVDHDFPHVNLIVYLTDTDGQTIIENQKPYFPQENDVILFTGRHYMKRPSKGRRIVLISTIFEYSKNND
tara:strand:- start:292 stop:819 length:528 start_codon:yes stop_codon:yes gene_type:complete